MSATKRKIDPERDEARAALLEMLQPGMTVYTILRHCSRSGMQREISLVIGCGDGARGRGSVCHLDYRASQLGLGRIGRHGGIVVPGCGMDMGFHLVYNLGRRLWPDGTSEPHGKRNGQPDSDGGYALRHEWL